MVECAPEDVIHFPAAIAPFAASTHFVLLSNAPKRPFLFLQSVEDESLCFILIPVLTVDPGYSIAVEPEDLDLLDWKHARQPSPQDLSCLAIVTVPEHGPVTANLLAPVFIDAVAGLGVQSVRSDGLYSHAQPLELAEGVGHC